MIIKWICVEDGSPEFNKAVVVKLEDGTTMGAILSEVNKDWYRNGYSIEFYFQQKVTHWHY